MTTDSGLSRPFQNPSSRWVFLFFILMTTGALAGPIVSNVTLELRQGTRLMEITYDLAHSEGLTCTVTVEATTGADRWILLREVTGAGSIGEGVTVGTGKSVLWNIGSEWDNQLLPNLKVRVRADDGQGSAYVLVSRISPSDQTEMVNVARETIVYFDDPVDPSTVTTDSFNLTANGETLPGRVVVSSTEKFATFFYDEPLPSSTEVRVVIDGDTIIGRNGIRIDADGDGIEGGTATADFRTLPLTRIAGTNVFGNVYDSLSGLPIAGATIRVDAFAVANAVTDSAGRFELMDMPAPEFFVHVDGSTATNAPSGFVYPNVGKPFHSVPGQSVHLNRNGVDFDIFLPPMAIADIQSLSSSADTDVGFGSAGKSTLATLFPEVDPAAWDRMSVTFPAGSARDDLGTPATTAAIIPVPKDRLPAPLPATLDPAFVISIQAPGATNFDVPAPVIFPNTDGQLPGEKSLIWSFNHDAGEWQVIGTGTVSADGLVVVSDPGVGILAPGWHFVWPGSQGNGGGGADGHDNPDDPLQNDKDNCKKLQSLAKSKSKQCALGVEGALPNGIPVLGCGLSFAAGLAGYTTDCNISPDQCGGANFALAAAVSAVGCIPGIGGAAAAGLTCLQTADAIKDATRCHNRLYPSAETGDESFELLDTRTGGSDHFTAKGEAVSKGSMAESLLREQAELIQAAGDVFSTLMGSDVWIGVEDTGELGRLYLIVGAIDDATGAISDGGEVITPQEQIAINTLPVPSNFGANDVQIAIDRFNDLTNGVITPAEFGVAEIAAAAQWMEAVFASAGAAGWEDPRSGALEASILLSEVEDQEIESDGSPLVEAQLLFNITDLDNGFSVRGQTSSRGQFANYVFALDRPYSITYLDPLTLQTGITVFRSGGSVLPFDIPKAFLIRSDEDTDGDGLSDEAERVIGTSISNPDTDGDGIDDFTEVTTDGLNPLDNRGFPTGIIARTSLIGQTMEVVVDTVPGLGLTAFLATGSHGLAIVDVDAFSNPIVLGQLDLDGDCTDVAYDALLDLAVVSGNAGGLHLVDISDPMLPRLSQTIEIEASQVEIANGIAYAASGGFLFSYDLFNPDRIQSVLISSGTIAGLTRQGDMLFAMDSLNELHAIRVDNIQLSVIGSVQLDQGGGKVFVAGGIIYAGALPSFFRGGYLTIDVSDPVHMALMARSTVESPNINTGRYLVDNGSGTGLLIGLSSLDLMGTVDPGDTTNFISRIPLPAAPKSVTIGSGIAFVADGTAGLLTVNYLGFDTGGVAPTASMDLGSLDINLEEPGIQVLEGSTISIPLEVTDDVQVRKVELLLDGEIAASDVSFPWELSLSVPVIKADASQVTAQVRALDTGGNAGLTSEVILELVPDTIAPTSVFTVPVDNEIYGQNFNTLQFGFSEPMDVDTLNRENFRLTNVNDPGRSIPLESMILRPPYSVALLQFPTLKPGDYEMTLKASSITDAAGNPLGLTDQVISFSINSNYTFLNNEGGSWHDPENWSTGEVPGPGDRIILDLPEGAVITFESGDTQIESLTGVAIIEMKGGRLEVNGAIQLDGQLRMSGGTLAKATMLPRIQGVNTNGDVDLLITASGTLDGVTIEGIAEVSTQRTAVTIESGITVNGELRLLRGVSMFFTGTEALLSGTGIVKFTGVSTVYAPNRIRLPEAGTLTIGAGIRLEAGSLSIYGFGLDSRLVNAGTIRANSANRSVVVGSLQGNGGSPDSVFENQGTLEAINGGILDLRVLAGGLGSAIVGAESKLILDGTAYTIDQDLVVTDTGKLTLKGGWNMVGQITINGELSIGGAYTLSQLNDANWSNNGGTLTVSGTLDLESGTLNVDDSFGQLVIDRGTIRNGTIAVSGAGRLSSLIATIEDVKLDGDFDMGRGQLRVSGGLEVNGAITTPQKVVFVGDTTISGTGTVAFFPLVNSFNPPTMEMSRGGILTIGSGITIEGEGIFRGYSYSVMTLVNHGTIRASVPGKKLTIGAKSSQSAAYVSLDNQGTVEAANGGILEIQNLRDRPGTVSLEGASHLILDGSAYVVDEAFSVPSTGMLTLNGGWDIQVPIDNAGVLNIGGAFTLPEFAKALNGAGTVVVTGILDLESGTLNLNDDIGELGLDDGTIKNGTIAISGSGFLTPSVNNGGVLEEIILSGSLTVNSASLTLSGGLTLNGTLTLEGGTSLFLLTDVSIDGVGSMLFSNTTISRLSGNQISELTIGNELTLDGFNLAFQSGIKILNFGTIRSSLPGAFFLVKAELENQGLLEVLDGARLELSNLAGNGVGNATLGAGSQLIIGGDLTRSLLGNITNNGGNVRLKGILDLESGTLSLDDAFGELLMGPGPAAIKNGTIAISGTGNLNPSAGTLENIVIEGEMRMKEFGGSILIRDDLTLNGTIRLQAPAIQIGFDGDQAINGAGKIVFETTVNIRTSLQMVNLPGELTIGSGITLEGGRVTFGFRSLYAGWGRVMDLVNLGTIRANVSDQTITFDPDFGSFDNQGTLEELNGGTIILP